ncbi:hypothetical protein [Desulfosporosinus lacus]|uniref:Uncharacterized protein n=1 Tax=Desulfosporosinus lacus DSM 15449 TaxID=1121420 RepID=A0A1M6BCK4_9FIRM|nr:hypothetical protein [Desulfosporosinus lacus]SHI46449.1 hypothetical protein SAMN02746098_04145 [Desulfosporosinus lacus DSM 15449]
MNKPQKSMKNTQKKKSIKNIWDYIASIAFILAGSYYLATQRPSQGAIYILVGLFFIFITRTRGNKKK